MIKQKFEVIPKAHKRTKKPFWQWTAISQYQTLTHDDTTWTNTKALLEPWIRNACFFHLTDIDEEERRKLYMNLTLDVEEVAREYLSNHFFNKGYAFSTFFLTKFEERSSAVYDTDHEEQDDEPSEDDEDCSTDY